MVTTANKTYATLLQLSAYTQYFFPFGSFIFPVILWSARKEESEFIDHNGRQAINFQLSMLVYTIVLTIIAVPIFIYNFFKGFTFIPNYESDWIYKDNIQWTIENFDTGKITGLIAIAIIAGFILLVLKVSEFFLILYAAVKNSNGIDYNYPLTINFIKSSIKLPVAGKQVQP